MNATTINHNWNEANYRYLSAALALVCGILENHTAREQNQPEEKNQEYLQQALQEAAAAMPAQVIQLKHVLRAAQAEYTKLEKPLTDAEVGGWM